MYDDFKIANYSNSLVSPEFYARPLSRLFKGDVIDGLTVVPGTGLKVTLQPGNAMLRYGSAAAASARMVSLVADFSLDIPAPDASNPRIDALVLYVDNSVNLPVVDASNPPTSANLDGPGVAKAKIVSGTPAANPVAPSDVAIQAAVGAGNSFTVLSLITIDPGVTVVASSKIRDFRKFAKVGSRNIESAPPYVDANGWTIRDYGTHKVGTKEVTESVSRVRFQNASVSSGNLPVGVANAGETTFNSATPNGGAYSDFIGVGRNTSFGSVTSLIMYYVALGPTTATTYNISATFYVEF
ncbi:hypothetical protein [Glutamicibacter halophytocola]|uniref:hypothetical protein n=1 Tax=Glutamicibacter halophytocola TaxID=1933880 RepID=UPI0015C572B8|nr:hypothetical protein [Glutamicibacter halophytocola]NQD39956.1 hypothetical protein [Glutamicibacter halophytocola]